MNATIKQLTLISDNRGYLTEVLKSGSEAIEQVHFSVSKPGVTRGNHYHKLRIEWMFVSSGIGKISLLENLSGEQQVLTVSGDIPMLVTIYPNITHTIVNCGTKPMHLFILTSKKHGNPDTDTFYPEKQKTP
jgi:UDP-2-acetamido-2,6-beta-L-arabino-hexul-4-ose reductase